jgi:hypothetical protein
MPGKKSFWFLLIMGIIYFFYRKGEAIKAESKAQKKSPEPLIFNNSNVIKYPASTVYFSHRDVVIRNVGESVIKDSQCPYFSDTNLMHVSHIKEIMRNLGKDDVLNSKSISEGVDILFATAKEIRGY